MCRFSNSQAKFDEAILAWAKLKNQCDACVRQFWLDAMGGRQIMTALLVVLALVAMCCVVQCVRCAYLRTEKPTGTGPDEHVDNPVS